MSKYTSEHAGALADVQAAGAAVVFSAVRVGTHTPATETFATPTTSSVLGYALQVEGTQKQYEAAKVVRTESVALFFVPTTLGELPEEDMTVLWGSKKYRVRLVEPLAPDGEAIAATVIVTR